MENADIEKIKQMGDEELAKAIASDGAGWEPEAYEAIRTVAMERNLKRGSQAKRLTQDISIEDLHLLQSQWFDKMTADMNSMKWRINLLLWLVVGISAVFSLIAVFLK